MALARSSDGRANVMVFNETLLPSRGSHGSSMAAVALFSLGAMGAVGWVTRLSAGGFPRSGRESNRISRRCIGVGGRGAPASSRCRYRSILGSDSEAASAVMVDDSLDALCGGRRTSSSVFATHSRSPPVRRSLCVDFRATSVLARGSSFRCAQSFGHQPPMLAPASLVSRTIRGPCLRCSLALTAMFLVSVSP